MTTMQRNHLQVCTCIYVRLDKFFVKRNHDMILYILIDFTKLFFKNDNTNATAYNQDKQFPRAAHCGNVNKKTTFNFTKKKKKKKNW